MPRYIVQHNQAGQWKQGDILEDKHFKDAKVDLQWWLEVGAVVPEGENVKPSAPPVDKGSMQGTDPTPVDLGITGQTAREMTGKK